MSNSFTKTAFLPFRDIQNLGMLHNGPLGVTQAIGRIGAPRKKNIEISGRIAVLFRGGFHVTWQRGMTGGRRSFESKVKRLHDVGMLVTVSVCHYHLTSMAFYQQKC